MSQNYQKFLRRKNIMFSGIQTIPTSSWLTFTVAEEAKILPPKNVINTAPDKARRWGRGTVNETLQLL
jgi:hypothetical protein